MRKEKLGAITIEDVMREGYDDLESYKAAWEIINGSWDPNSAVYVVSFELKERYDLSTVTAAVNGSQPMQIWELEKIEPSHVP